MTLSDSLGHAESALHMSSALIAEKSIESSPLLETVCATRLDDCLHPALRHIVNWLTQVKPNPFANIAELIDEVYLIMSSLLHYHYLQDTKGGASFGESFYGLARTKVDGTPMTHQDRIKSLLWLTAVPYVCSKLVRRLDKYRLQLADGVLFHDLERRTKLLICYCWGTANALLSCLRVFHLMSGSGTPELKFQNISLKPSSVQCEPPVAIQFLAFAAQLATAVTRNVANISLNQSMGFSNRTVLPPPRYDRRAKDYLGSCALCLIKPPVSPTAVSTSGYVYCFSCIMHHVQANKNAKCPITNVPISLQHLVRIYYVNTSF